MIEYWAICRNCDDKKQCFSTDAANWWAHLHARINIHNVEICELIEPYKRTPFIQNYRYIHRRPRPKKP